MKLKKNLKVHSQDGPYYLLGKVQSEDIIMCGPWMHCKKWLFLFSNHIIKSAGLCAHGEKLYYVQWLIIKHCLIPLRHTAHCWPDSQRENEKHHLHQHGCLHGFPYYLVNPHHWLFTVKCCRAPSSKGYEHGFMTSCSRRLHVESNQGWVLHNVLPATLFSCAILDLDLSFYLFALFQSAPLHDCKQKNVID